METTYQITCIENEDDLAALNRDKSKRFAEYDFQGRRVSIGRNSIHDYPAMLHPLLVDELLDEYGKRDDVFYDPFCGSGTSLVQAIKKNLVSFGTDINPLALLIAYVRGINIESDEYSEWLDFFLREYPSAPSNIPEIKNINFWYSDKVVSDLGKIRSIILQITDTPIRMLFLTAFSTTVRKVSFTKKNEFKRVRMSPDQIQKCGIDTYRIFLQVINEYYTVLEKEKVGGVYQLYLNDLRKGIPFNEKVDLIITSPPYGDSKTTVAYGQFSSFSLEWIKGLNPFGDADLKLDNMLLGGSDSKNINIPDISFELKRTVELISLKDIKRAKEVNLFFSDLFICIENIVSKLNKNATVCFIVGNRNVKNITIPMDKIIIDFFSYFGLEHLETRIRKISNKRMAIKNSPTNIKGETSATMNYEYIVILKEK